MLELDHAGVSCSGTRGLPRLLEFVKHVGEKAAVTFRGVVRAPREMNSGNSALVERQARQHFLGRADLPQRGTQAVTQGFNVVEVFAKNQRARQLEGIANAFGLDQRVPVAVAADPGAEADERG